MMSLHCVHCASFLSILLPGIGLSVLHPHQSPIETIIVHTPPYYKNVARGPAYTIKHGSVSTRGRRLFHIHEFQLESPGELTKLSQDRDDTTLRAWKDVQGYWELGTGRDTIFRSIKPRDVALGGTPTIQSKQ